MTRLLIKIIFCLVLLASSYAKAQTKDELKFSPQIISLLDSGLTYLKKGMHEKGFIEFEKAIRLDSTNIYLYEIKSSWEASTKNYEQVVQTSIRQLKLKPFEPLYHMRIASFYLKLGDSAKASPYFSNAIKYGKLMLDTLKTADNFQPISNKLIIALATFLSGNEILGTRLLNDLYKEEGEGPASAVYPYLNKNKTELLKVWLSER